MNPATPLSNPHPMTVPSHIQVQVDPDIIKELPRFFGGRLATLRELLQNAYRAGADNVAITIEGNILTIEDDGAGCPDPQLLLTAGKTGWDKSRIAQPAGMGFYSILNPDISAAVRVQSQNWAVNLLPQQVLAGQLSPIESLAVMQRGFHVRVILVSSTGVEDDVRRARGYYPFQLTINREVVPVDQWSPTWELDTPVGRLGVRLRGTRRRSESRLAIWEYRPIHGDAFSQALERVATPLGHAILGSCSLHWFVDPSSGVTAKLPDRNDLTDDAALDAAATTLLRHVEQHLITEAQKICTGWPDVLPKSIKEPTWLLKTGVGSAVLAQLGWREADRTCHEDNDVWYVPNDGWQFQNGCETTHTRTYVSVGADWVADSINNAKARGALLPYAVVDPDGLMPTLIKGTKPVEGSKNWIALAKEIRVGEYRLPFLLPADLAEDGLVLACDADTAVSALMGNLVELPNLKARIGDLLVGYAATHDDEQLGDGWGDYKSDRLDTDQVEKDLIEQVSNDFIGGRRAQARQHLHHLQAQLSQLHELSSPIRFLDKRPSVTALGKAIARVERDLEHDIKASKQEARLPE